MTYLLCSLCVALLTYKVATYYYTWREEQIMAHRRIVTSGYIYFIQQQAGNKLLVKIGRSNDPIRRLRQLRTSVPYGITVLGIMPTMDDVRSEKMIHQRFKHLRVSKRQEWFRITVPLLLYINAVSDPVTTAVVRKAVR